MELYHITKEKYLTSILTEGLKINSGKTGFCRKDAHKRYKSNYGMQPIFLTNDIEFISKTMLTNGWVKTNKAVVLKVNVELNEINSSEGWYKDGINGVEPKEFRYFSNIEPNNIEIINIDFKNFELKY
jgi:hypothetical protein